MADLFVTWDEAQEERLPHYCVCCAVPATEWADWRIGKTRHRVFSIETTYVDVTLPVCLKHRELPWIPLYRVNVKEIHEDGVVLGHVSPGFVEAVWDFREEREAQPAYSDAGDAYSSPPQYEADAFDDGPRHLSRRAYVDRSPSPIWSLPKLILVAIGLLVLAPCGILGVFFLLGLLGLLFSLVIG